MADGGVNQPLTMDKKTWAMDKDMRGGCLVGVTILGVTRGNWWFSVKSCGRTCDGAGCFCYLQCNIPVSLGEARLYVHPKVRGSQRKCGTGASIISVGLVTLLLVILMVGTWGLNFRYPRCLRSFLWSTCLRQAEVVAAPGQDQGGGAAANPGANANACYQMNG